MTQTIKIKRSTGSSAPTNIAAGELAYSKGSGTLYIGDPDTNNANSPLAIGGAIVNNAGTPALASGVTAEEIRNLIDLGSSDNAAFTNLTLSGDLTVNGTTTTLNTATLDVEDKNITLNFGSGDTSGSADGSGITIQDAVDASTNATMLWDATDNEFNFSHGLQIGGTEIVGASRRFRAADGTSVKAAYGFSNSSSTGLSYSSTNNRISFLSGGAVRAYIQTGSSNPEVETMYVNGIIQANGKVTWTGGSSTLANIAYNKRLSTLAFNTSTGVLTFTHGDTTTTTVDLDGRFLQDVAFSNIQAGSVLLSSETFSDVDTQLMSAAAINDRIESFGYTTNVGDITQVTISSTDSSISGTGTGSAGAISFDLEVATIDGGTY